MASSQDSRIKAIDELLASAELSHGIRSHSGWVRSRSPRGGGDQAPRNHRVGRTLPLALPGEIDVIQVPGWSDLGWLMHGFSTRTGGSSQCYSAMRAEGSGQPCGELNLGFTQSDPDDSVLSNRAKFLAAVRSLNTTAPATKNAPVAGLVTLKQIHSPMIRTVGKADAADKPRMKADGMMTAERGVVLGILTADCIPVLIADRKRRAVAAFHAGWRGTVKRIVERGVGRMRVEFGSRPADLVAAIGPGIGQCCYSVGAEVQEEFTSQFDYADELFCEIYDADPVREKYPMLFLTARAPGHSQIGPAIHLDLIEANKRQLLHAGIAEQAIYVVGECTSCRTDRFFSHRAEHGFTGRMMSVVGIV